MSVLKRIVENNLKEAKKHLIFLEQRNEFHRMELEENKKSIEQTKENIAEFEGFLNDERKN